MALNSLVCADVPLRNYSLTVLYGLLTRKQKGVWKPNFVWTFPRAGI